MREGDILAELSSPELAAAVEVPALWGAIQPCRFRSGYFTLPGLRLPMGLERFLKIDAQLQTRSQNASAACCF